MTKINCASEIFREWASQVSDILDELPRTTITGQPLEYSDDEFQKIMTKLQQCSMNFAEFPIYPINEKIASELVYSQLAGYENE
jgi:hypothetical protein|tara:strand:+ start:1671 stop:1922 length:252 start_codon:yes stop_codon:yes gene_type:complete